MTFREKVQPLTEDEAGQLTGGFADVDMSLPAMADLKNKGYCDNTNCPQDTMNSDECSNRNCRTTCRCGGGKTDFENNSGSPKFRNACYETEQIQYNDRQRRRICRLQHAERQSDAVYARNHGAARRVSGPYGRLRTGASVALPLFDGEVVCRVRRQEVPLFGFE